MSIDYHFIGIGGVGMSALAKIVLEQGCSVTGSDQLPSATTDRLLQAGAKITFGHRPLAKGRTISVVYSSAINRDHEEWESARALGFTCLHRSELLEQLMDKKSALVVAGAHGKTSTTALLAHTLQTAGLDPSYAVGGFSSSLKSNGHHGKGDYFVAEGDESDGSFLKTSPEGAILNNIDADHIGAHWRTFEELLRGYQTFIKNVRNRELFVYNGDDAYLRKWNPEGVTFGFCTDVDVRAENLSFDGFRTRFTLIDQGERFKQVELALLGSYNLLNALGVYTLATRLGIDRRTIFDAFATFKGVKRRMELKSQMHDIYVVDDYAHHPKELLATVHALRRAFPSRRIVKVFQPHRYTRVAALQNEFISALESISDHLIVTDIFAAGEKAEQGISTDLFLDSLEQRMEFHYVPRHGVAPYLLRICQPGDLLVFMGAGDISSVSDEVARELKFAKIGS